MPATVERLRRSVDTALAGYLEVAMARLRGYGGTLGPAADAVESFLTGGKRLRPVVLLLGFQAGGGEDAEAVMGPALALELLHTCALLHDDVIDDAQTRRGVPAVHRQFAEHHVRRQLRGDAEAYGAAVAVLLGDLAFVQADELFLQAAERGVPVAPLLQAQRRFTVLREEVMVGQFLDVHAAHAGAASREEAIEVATLKSGRYTVRRPLEIGALLAGAPAELVDGLGAFGDPLGRAFQIRDDLLGVFGSEHVTGKSAASDLAEGKTTLLVAETLARLDDDTRRRFRALLGQPGLDADGAARLRAWMDESGGSAATEAFLREQVEMSLAALARLALPGGIADTLSGLVRFVAERDH